MKNSALSKELGEIKNTLLFTVFFVVLILVITWL
jgi:hypothetical protein